jgi:hypothetical protein
MVYKERDLDRNYLIAVFNCDLESVIVSVTNGMNSNGHDKASSQLM